MALVSKGWRLVVELIDTGGNGTTRTYELTSATAAEAVTDGAAVLAAIAGASDAVVKQYTLGEKFVEGVLTYPADAEVEENAQITAQIVGEPHKSAIINIPAPKDTCFMAATGPGHNVVDTADAAVAAYLALFAPAAECKISDGEFIALTTAKGKRVHFKSNKG